MMKRLVILLSVCAIAGYGCSNATTTQKSTAWGSVIGTAVGAGVGYAVGGGKGAAIGAGTGLLVGGLAGMGVGKYMDHQEQELRQALAASEAASIQREQDVLALSFKSDVMFDVDSATVNPGFYDEIDRVGAVLVRYPETTILIEGHTDSTGSEEYNLKLSERRAAEVQKLLVARGVAAGRVQTIGMGESKPLADNTTEAGRQLNRRVRILIRPNQV